MIRIVIGLILSVVSTSFAVAQGEETINCDSPLMVSSRLTESTYWTSDQFSCGQMKFNGASCLTASAWDGTIWQYRNMCRRNRTGVTWTNIARQIIWDINLQVDRTLWYMQIYRDDQEEHCFRGIALINNKRHFIEYCDLARQSPFNEESVRETLAQMNI